MTFWQRAKERPVLYLLAGIGMIRCLNYVLDALDFLTDWIQG